MKISPIKISFFKGLLILFTLYSCSEEMEETPINEGDKSKPENLIMPSGTTVHEGTPPPSSNDESAPVIENLEQELYVFQETDFSVSFSIANLNTNVGGIYFQIQGADIYYDVPFNSDFLNDENIIIPIGLDPEFTFEAFNLYFCIYDENGLISNALSSQILNKEAPDNPDKKDSTDIDDTPYDGRLIGNIIPRELSVTGSDAFYDGEKWLTAGRSGIFTSYDGLNWDRINSNLVDGYMSRIISNGDIYVAVGPDVYYSKDLNNWSIASGISIRDFEDIIWTGEEFFITDRNGVYRSEDGKEWNFTEIDRENSDLSFAGFQKIFWINNKLFGIGRDISFYKCYTSDDKGKTWKRHNVSGQYSQTFRASPGSLFQHNNTLYCWGYFYNSEPQLAKSNDGESWEFVTGTTDLVPDQAIKYNDKFIANEQGKLYSSENGHQWQPLYEGDHAKIEKIVPSEVGIMAIGDDVLMSEDGVNWNNTIPHLLPKLSVNYDNDRLVFTSRIDDGILYTDDNVNFNLIAYSKYGGYTSGTWDGEKFIAVGENGKIIYIKNGMVSSSASPTSFDLEDVASSFKGNVAVGKNGTILYSSDGENWNDHSLSPEFDLQKVEFIDDVFYAAGDGLYKSNDGQNWTEVLSHEQYGDILDLEIEDDIMVAVTDARTDVLVSSDGGNTWIENRVIKEDEFYTIDSIVNTGDEFVLLIHTSRNKIHLYASDNGISWSPILEDFLNVSYDFEWTGSEFIITGDHIWIGEISN